MTLILFAQTDRIITIICNDTFQLLACSEIFYENGIAVWLFSNSYSWEKMGQDYRVEERFGFYGKEPEIRGIVQ